MGGDISDGAKIAITLIVLGVILTTVFTILGFTRGATQQGLNSVENSMSALQLSVFNDYDQTIISGTKVRAALKLFAREPLALVVRTSLQMKNAQNTGFNYGVLMEGSASPPAAAITRAMTKNAGDSFYTMNLKRNSNNTLSRNNNYVNTEKSGTVEFIRTTADFLAELIRDDTGTIVGICFTQQ